MTHLTSSRYLAVHTVLYQRWHEHHGTPLHYLRPAAQWALHAYFRVSEDLTDTELLDHRTKISKLQPSLPQRAGKALKRLEGFYPSPVVSGAVEPGPKRIVVYPLVRPQIDPHRFASAVLLLARRQLEDKQQGSGPDLPGRKAS